MTVDECVLVSRPQNNCFKFFENLSKCYFTTGGMSNNLFNSTSCPNRTVHSVGKTCSRYVGILSLFFLRDWDGKGVMGTEQSAGVLELGSFNRNNLRTERYEATFHFPWEGEARRSTQIGTEGKFAKPCCVFRSSEQIECAYIRCTTSYRAILRGKSELSWRKLNHLKAY